MQWNYGDLFDALEKKVPAEHVALLHADTRITWGELGQRSNNIARALLAQGLQAGDKVALYMRNGPAYLETLIGCFKARLVHVNVNYRYKAQELTYILDNADARAVIYDAEFAPLVAAVRTRAPEVLAWVEVPQEAGPGQPQTLDYREISSTGSGQPL